MHMYTKENGVTSWSGNDKEFIHFEEDSGLFHIGQSYEEAPASKTVCTDCGGSEFYVGLGCCFTAIKCITCEWELCVHEG